MDRTLLTRAFPAAVLAAALAMTGCEVDSFMFDQSKTGYFEHQPTMLPILDRIDVIESDETLWGETTGVMQEDLVPNDLTYVLAPGDHLTVEIQELRTAETWDIIARRIDATGNFRISGIGDIRAAGRTVQEFEDHVAELMEQFVVSPRVYVHVDETTAFTYTIHGQVFNPGLYMLRKPDLRLNEALASVGGVPQNTDRIIVIRQVPLTEDYLAPYERERDAAPQQTPRRDRQQAPVDIEDLIDQLEDDETSPGSLGSLSRERMTDAHLMQDNARPSRRDPLVDVDELRPARVSEHEIEDLEDFRRQVAQPLLPEPPVDQTFIFVDGQWVRAAGAGPAPAAEAESSRSRPQQEFPAPEGSRRWTDVSPTSRAQARQQRLVAERFIEIPYYRLLVDGSYDIVVRPGDRIYVDGPTPGLVYISGEINRPGVFDLPLMRERLTLSRFIAAAGDLGPVAQPERVDLTRMIAPDREATIRVNLAAIRNRTEPDIFIKPGDHIHIGTSWIATPLAVIRNGFRVTYGFGFLMDRNFGNDVFGAPPFRGTQ